MPSMLWPGAGEPAGASTGACGTGTPSGPGGPRDPGDARWPRVATDASGRLLEPPPRLRARPEPAAATTPTLIAHHVCRRRRARTACRRAEGRMGSPRAPVSRWARARRPLVIVPSLCLESGRSGCRALAAAGRRGRDREREAPARRGAGRRRTRRRQPHPCRSGPPDCDTWRTHLLGLVRAPSAPAPTRCRYTNLPGTRPAAPAEGSTGKSR